jgi:hypothetical protein
MSGIEGASRKALKSKGSGPQSPESADIRNARCSFCGRHRDSVRSLVLGPTPAVGICDECAELALEIMKQEHRDVGR